MIVRMASGNSTKSRRELGGRSLVVQGGEIGLTTRAGNFQSYTNFSMEIEHGVSSPKDLPTMFGYVYCVKTSSGIQRFVSFILIV